MADLIGRRLGQYEITAKLGSGGMATVYRARQGSVGRDVAIKVIESKLAETPEFIRRFEREAHTIATLNHPHILKLFDFGREGDLFYLVMELQPGGSLTDRIRQGPFPADRVSRVLDQLASALDYAHSKGIIHRDLKPQNVLFDETGEVHLTDFGIAKVLTETTALTASGLAMGTPAYMAPEQWQAGVVDVRADLYALGVMLFEMLSGRVPFDADTPYQMMHAHIYEPPPSLWNLRPDLPRSVEKVVDKALAKDPAQRFQSAGELAAAFKMALTGQTSPGIEMPVTPSSVQTTNVTAPLGTDYPPPSAARQNRSLLLAVGAVILIGVLGVLAVIVATSNPPTPASPTAPVALLPTQTVTPTPTASTTYTPELRATASATTARKTATATAKPSSTQTPSPTLDIHAAAVGTINAEATLTATHFPPTPTIDLPATIDAERTAIMGETRTAGETATAIIVASYTKTPTFTNTPQPTMTPTNTPTPTPTNTPTPMPILTAAGVCSVDGVATFTVFNTGGAMGADVGYIVFDASGNTIKIGAIKLDSGASEMIQVTGIYGKLTLSFPDRGVAADTTCQKPTPTRPPVLAQGGGGTLIEAMYGSGPDSLTPLTCADTACSRITGLLFPSLLGTNPQTQSFEKGWPGSLAKDWTISGGNQVITYKLRDDMKWSDGVPITSQDYQFLWKLANDPNSGFPRTTPSTISQRWRRRTITPLS